MIEHRYSVQSVRSAIQILKLFSEEKTEWCLSEIAKIKDWSPSTTKRLLDMLVKYGYLKKSVKKIYTLDHSILRLAGVVKVTMDIYREAQPFIDQLATKYNQAVHLGILEDTHVIYLEKVDSVQNIPLSSSLGKVSPAYCTGCGKILVAFKNKKEQDAILQKIEAQGMNQFCNNTVTDINILKEQLDIIRKDKISVCIEEYSRGITSAAVPIFDYTKKVIASISITGPSETFHNRMLEELKQVGKLLSQNLGYVK